MRLLLTLGLALGALVALQPKRSSAEPAVSGFVVKAEFSHDPHAFTQGLEYERRCDSSDSSEVDENCTDVFWESTGMYGQSSIRKVDARTGTVLQSISLPPQWFAEGLTKIGDTLYQLTWRTGTIFKWRVVDGQLQKVGELAGPLTDGWGLTNNGSHLIATDSSPVLSFIDPGSLQVTRTLTVTDNGSEVRWLNELEMIDGELWANVWQSDCLAQIDLDTGAVAHWVVLSGLRHGLHQRHPEHHQMDVLNGIAYDAERGRLFVTGKNWPRLFEIELRRGSDSNVQGLSLEQVRQQCRK